MLKRAMGALLLSFVLLGAGDQGRTEASGMGGPASPRHVAAGALPAFALFGWVSPPVESTTAARIAELAGAGLNLMMPAWADSGRLEDNMARLDLAAANGLRCLIWDRRFEYVEAAGVNTLSGQSLLDEIVASYRMHPAFGGYYLGDEPPAEQFSLLGEIHDALRARDPEHPAWNNLLPAAGVGGWSAWDQYVRAYLDSTHARVLSYDEYDFQIGGDRGLFVHQLAAAGAMAREYGIPFWVIVQLIQHYQYRALTDGEMRWQVSMALAYGASGVGYFTYWTPAPDPALDWHDGIIGRDGTRSHWYDAVALIHARVAGAGRVLTRLLWLGTTHSGSVPEGATAFTPGAWIAAVDGRAALGTFSDSIGTRYVLVANSDSLAPQSIVLTLPGAREVARLSDDAARWDTLTPSGPGPRVTCDLASGDFALLRVGGPGEPLRTRAGPGMRLEPNPGSGALRFEFARVHGRARIEIVDLGGRRIWSRAIPEGSSSLVWDGTLDGGGTAAAGLYIARASDQLGVTALRLSWLGRR